MLRPRVLLDANVLVFTDAVAADGQARSAPGNLGAEVLGDANDAYWTKFGLKLRRSSAETLSKLGAGADAASVPSSMAGRRPSRRDGSRSTRLAARDTGAGVQPRPGVAALASARMVGQVVQSGARQRRACSSC